MIREIHGRFLLGVFLVMLGLSIVPTTCLHAQSSISLMETSISLVVEPKK